MPVVDVVNLKGKKVGPGRAGRRGIWRQGEPEPAARSRAGIWPGCARARTRPKDKSEVRRRPQALEAEGHGPRARRLDSVVALAPWRHGARTAAARLCYRAAEENVARRVALGAVRQAGEREIDGSGWLAARIAQDEGVSRRRLASWMAIRERYCWSTTAKSQSGTCQPQSRRREAGRAGCAAALRSAAA